MDLQFWIYVIVAIIYIVSRAIKKQEAASKEAQERRADKEADFKAPNRSERPKQLTFEELLKEITEAKQTQPQVTRQEPKRYQAPQQPEYVDYDDNIGEEEQDLEDVNYDHRKRDKVYDVYEEAKRQAFNRPSLEETLKVTDTKVQFGKFKEFDQQERNYLLDEYARSFQDPEGLKKAVVLSEILNRKF